VMSNIAQAISMIDPSVGHATSMPDWSPAGDFVVFAAYDSTKNFVRLLGDDIVAASIVEVPVSYFPRSKQEGKKIGLGDWFIGTRTFWKYRNG